MMEQIDRDVMRTHPDMHFFSGSDGSAVTHREVLAIHPMLPADCRTNLLSLTMVLFPLAQTLPNQADLEVCFLPDGLCNF